MKHVKLFEQFINEQDSQEILSQYAEELKAEGYDIELGTSNLRIMGIKPKFDKRYKGLVWTFFYEPNHWAGKDFNARGYIDRSKYDIPDHFEWTRYANAHLDVSIKSSKDIIKGLKSFKKWDVEFNWNFWEYYWSTVQDQKTAYRRTKRGDLTRQDIKDMDDFHSGWWSGSTITKHPVLGFNIISVENSGITYHWDGKDVWYGNIKGGKDWKFGQITSIENLYSMSNRSSPHDSTRAWESKRHSLDRSVDYVEKSEAIYHDRRR
jgi:hypothetical protein